MTKKLRLAFLCLLGLLAFTNTSMNAQTTLSQGDIAIISISTGGEDFAFVTFVDLDAGTVIYFTDEEADGDLTIGTGEGTVQYTAPAGGITAGTVVTGNSAGSATDFSSTSDGSMVLGNSGDGILAYQGSSVGNVTTFLHAVGEDSGDIGTFPGGTLTASDYVLIGNDDGNYTGGTSGTAAALLSDINDNSNWTVSGSASISPPASFTVGAAAPTIAFDASSSSETETDATFSVNIPVTVTNYSGSQIDVDVDVTGGTAEMADYTLNTSSLSFTANGTQNISIDIIPDTDDFDDETIIITLTETSMVTDLVITDNTHTITVTDDEDPPTIGFDSDSSSETETDATFSVDVPVTVTNYSGSQIDVSVAVTGGTAESGDYTLNTTALSFTTNETQNVSIDINEDTDDFDNETIIITITETSSVSGLSISQSTHTITVTEDEAAPVPTAGSVIITEVLDSDVGFNNDYLELFNNSSTTVSLSTSKLIRLATDGTTEYVYDFGTDESTASADVTIPAYGFMIIARGATRSSYETAFSITLDAEVTFNGGRTDLFFGTGRRWSLRTGGTADSDDGTLIDDTLVGVGSTKSFRNIFTDSFETGTTSEGTPGTLEYLLYTGDAWVNSTAMDATTGTQDAYFFSDYTISSDADANNVGVNTGNTLTLNSSISLDVNGNLTVNGTFNINSGGSLIIDGTSTGDVTYNRNIPTGGIVPPDFYLISSPVVGQDIDAFVSAEDLATGTGDNVGLGDYSNSTPGWFYYQSGASGTGDFISGDGRAIALATAGDISFTGTVDDTDTGVDIGLTSNSNGFNLIGNPYPSFINANSNADGTNNLLSINSGDLTELTIWFWDETTDSYDLINQASSAFHIAPAQGFFVSSSGSNTFEFEENMQSHQSSDSFQRTSNSRPEINLVMTDGTDTRDADIFYISGTTTGFDNGFDSSIFSGVGNSFAIYTHTVANGNGRNLGIQSLPDDNFENMIIPVGINATSGTQITISAGIFNLPAEINVYLEDKNDGSFTVLDSSSDFTTTLDSDLNGIGRFYLHTSSQVLSVNEINLENISMYTSDANNLRVVGIQNGTANVSIYNILGKEVLKTSFEGNGLNDVALPNLRTGVYIVQLATEIGTLNKKIIIE